MAMPDAPLHQTDRHMASCFVIIGAVRRLAGALDTVEHFRRYNRGDESNRLRLTQRSRASPRRAGFLDASTVANVPVNAGAPGRNPAVRSTTRQEEN